MRPGGGAGMAGTAARGGAARPAAVVRATLLAAVLGLAPLAAPPVRAAEGEVIVRLRLLAGFDIGDPSRRRFGDLEWLGGAELSSSDRRFGGFSGLVTTDGGQRLLAVTDYGNRLSARLELDAAGRPVAVRDARFARLTGTDGKPIPGKRAADAEAVAVDHAGGGTDYLVSLESRGVILVYSGEPPFAARPRAIPFPPAVADEPENERGEALAVVPPGGAHAGALLIFAENPSDGGTEIAGAMRIGAAWRPVSLAASGGYAATDAAFLPGGDLLVLERRFGFATGVGMRIRRIAAATIAPGAVLDGPVVVEADLGQEIDNMEALAVDRDAAGTVLTLMSDDNRSLLQRTVLLRFRLAGD